MSEEIGPEVKVGVEDLEAHLAHEDAENALKYDDDDSPFESVQDDGGGVMSPMSQQYDDIKKISGTGGSEVATLLNEIRDSLRDIFHTSIDQANMVMEMMGQGRPYAHLPEIGTSTKLAPAQKVVEKIKHGTRRAFAGTVGRAFRWLSHRSWWRTIPSFLSVLILNSLVCGAARAVGKKAQVDAICHQSMAILHDLGGVVSAGLGSLPVGGKWFQSLVQSLWMIVIGIAEAPLRPIVLRAQERFNDIKERRAQAIQELKDMWCPSVSRVTVQVRDGAELGRQTISEMSTALRRQLRVDVSIGVPRQKIHLLPGQTATVRMAVENPKGGILNANPAGTGKTLTAIGVIVNLRRDAYVVTQAGIESIWRLEGRKWGSGVVAVTVPKKLHDHRPRATPTAPFRICVLTYDALKKHCDGSDSSVDELAASLNLEHGTLVLDECHRLPSSDRILQLCIRARFRLLLSATPFVSLRDFPRLLNVCAGRDEYPTTAAGINDRYRNINAHRAGFIKVLNETEKLLRHMLNLLLAVIVLDGSFGAAGAAAAVTAGTRAYRNSQMLFSGIHGLLQYLKWCDQAATTYENLHLKHVTEDAKLWVTFSRSDATTVAAVRSRIEPVLMSSYQIELGLRWCVQRLTADEKEVLGLTAPTENAQTLGVTSDRWSYLGQALGWMDETYVTDRVDLSTSWSSQTSTYSFRSETTRKRLADKAQLPSKSAKLLSILELSIKERRKTGVYMPELGSFNVAFLSALLHVHKVAHVVARVSSIRELPRTFNLDYYVRSRPPRVYVALVEAYEGYDLFGVQKFVWASLPLHPETFLQVRGRFQRARGNDYLPQSRRTVHEVYLQALSGKVDRSQDISEYLLTEIVPALDETQIVQNAGAAFKNAGAKLTVATYGARLIDLALNPAKLRGWTKRFQLTDHDIDVEKLQAMNEPVPAFGRLSHHPTPDTEMYSTLMLRVREITTVTHSIFTHKRNWRGDTPDCNIWPVVPLDEACEVTLTNDEDDCRLLHLDPGCSAMDDAALNKQAKQQTKLLRKQKHSKEDYVHINAMLEKAMERLKRRAYVEATDKSAEKITKASLGGSRGEGGTSRQAGIIS